MVRRLTAKKIDQVLRGVQPNAGIEAAYRKKLQALIAEMDQSVVYWLRAAYRANEPIMAQDRTPADGLRDAIRKLARRWQKNFDEVAQALAEYFSQAVAERSSGALRAILKKAGFTVKFKVTPAMRDIMQATIGQQVSLIKSIPNQYFTNIEGLVMRSVQTGRDLGQLTKDLQEQGVPAYLLHTPHVGAMRSKTVTTKLDELIREPQPRWPPNQVEAARAKVLGKE